MKTADCKAGGGLSRWRFSARSFEMWSEFAVHALGLAILGWLIFKIAEICG
jgi:hypothetical protein